MCRKATANRSRVGRAFNGGSGRMTAVVTPTTGCEVGSTGRATECWQEGGTSSTREVGTLISADEMLVSGPTALYKWLCGDGRALQA
ncbi:hypothetical protein NDU88_008295 [Pleurodeles waltl]|uniref:Uncharacterized protein n=1 Tax=Pleurodeles waltl TaxID=8319 RepID=A0AAV7NVP0_PLEWA|nr:hypothetical protein NDU88_008295 [Pleurodeles waltl]